MPADVFTRGSSLANQPKRIIIGKEVLQLVLLQLLLLLLIA